MISQKVVNYIFLSVLFPVVVCSFDYIIKNYDLKILMEGNIAIVKIFILIWYYISLNCYYKNQVWIKQKSILIIISFSLMCSIETLLFANIFWVGFNWLDILYICIFCIMILSIFTLNNIFYILLFSCICCLYLCFPPVLSFLYKYYSLNLNFELYNLFVSNIFAILSFIIFSVLLIEIIHNNKFKIKFYRILRAATFFSFVLTPFVFSITYYNISIVSGYKAFIYNYDDLIRSHIIKLRKSYNRFRNIDNGILFKLIKEQEKSELQLLENKFYLYEIDEEIHVTPLAESIGVTWADYYQESLVAEGYKFFRIKISKSVDCLNDRLRLYELELYKEVPINIRDKYSKEKLIISYFGDESGEPEKKYYLLFPKFVNYNIDSHSNSFIDGYKHIDFIQTDGGFSIRNWYNANQHKSFNDIYEKYIISINFLSTYIANSSNYLDGSYLIINKILSQDYLSGYFNYLLYSLSIVFQSGYDSIASVDFIVDTMNLFQSILCYFLLLLFGGTIIFNEN